MRQSNDGKWIPDPEKLISRLPELPGVLDPRCKAHKIPGCSACKSLAGVLDEEGQISIPSNPDVAKKYAGPPQIPTVPERVILPTQEDLEKARTYLDIPVEPDHSTQAVAIRYFFQPLPKGKPIQLDNGNTIGWPQELDGMSPQNIATFLMMPQFIYSDYEKNKNNLPKRIFVTADEAINRPLHKLPELNAAESDNNFTVTHVGTEVIQQAEPMVIHIPGRPPRQQKKRIPPPAQLIEDLEKAKADHKLLKARYNKSLEEGVRLSKKESASARTLSLRKIKAIKDEIDSYKEHHLVDVPFTGSSPMDIVIPPCPEGSEEIFEKQYIRQYILEAFTEGPNISRDYHYINFENKIIRRMYVLNFFRGWPNHTARSQWLLNGRPTPNDPMFEEKYGWFDSRADEKNEYLRDVDPRARDYAAQTGYRRGEGGFVADDSIRRVGPGTVGGWHGAGAGPSSDERGDSADFHKDYKGNDQADHSDSRSSATKGVHWNKKI